jgi:hypothetical protein
MSNAICQITSGTATSTRKYYTNTEEVTICTGSRLVILTSVANVVTTTDLASRLVTFRTNQIASGQHREETAFWNEFNIVRPQLLGALLDRVCRGLARIPDIRLSSTSRIVDFEKWSSACETEPGVFMRAREPNVHEAVEDLFEQNPVALAIREFMADKDYWCGTTAALLQLLEKLDRSEERPSKWKEWPRDPGDFGARLWNNATISLLPKIGIKVSRHRLPDGKRTKQLELRRIAPSETGTRTAGPAEANAEPPKGARESESAALVTLRRVK